MSLPPGFEGPIEYFEEFFKFIDKYKYLYIFPNTQILLTNALNKIEVDLEAIDVFSDGFDIRNTNDDYLSSFFQDLNNLSIPYEEFSHNDNLECKTSTGLSQKKKHEITYLAKEIEDICKQANCDTVVDFGSGLGYLDEQLFKTTDLNVLGLECNERNYITAKKRQKKYVESEQRLKYMKHTINRKSCSKIQEFVEDKFPNSNGICIAGLHACADLAVYAMNIFLKMERVRALAIMPCCYHKLLPYCVIQNRVIYDLFQNFPLSDPLRKVYERSYRFNYFMVPFFRLATQRPDLKNETLENRVFYLLSRAVLQVYACRNNCTLKKKNRIAVHLKTLENNFEAYAALAVSGFKVISCSDEQEDEKELQVEELVSIWREIPQHKFKKAAIFILLQNCLQPVFENFVLYDRLIFMQDNGGTVENCRYKKIVDETISPRCLALLAKKV